MDELCDEVVRQWKSSFDRFGDDLCELIVSYLPFEDKLRLECLSKQFRTLVFNKQFSIEIPFNESDEGMDKLPKLLTKAGNDYEIKVKVLELVLKKCPNIVKVVIRIEVNEKVLSMIGDLCPQLKSFEYSRWIEERHLSFAEKYGHKIQELVICGNEETCKKFTLYCPELKNIDLYLCDERTESLQNLENILGGIFSRNVQYFKKLCERLSNKLKSIELIFNMLTHEELKTCLLSISLLKNLKTLRLSMSLSICHPICEYIETIGQKCPKISKLGLSSLSGPPISKPDNFLDIISSFKSIKSLGLHFIEFGVNVLEGSVESLSQCKQLKRLKFDNISLTEDFFGGIDTALPNLQTLECDYYCNFNNTNVGNFSFIEPFVKMKFIQKVIISYESQYGWQWYFGKQYNEMKLSNEKIEAITDNCGLITYGLYPVIDDNDYEVSDYGDDDEEDGVDVCDSDDVDNTSTRTFKNYMW